jgi:hypothetical protein
MVNEVLIREATMKLISGGLAGVCFAVAAFAAIPSSAQQAPPTMTVCDTKYVPVCTVEANGSYSCVYVVVSHNCREVEITINPDP